MPKPKWHVKSKTYDWPAMKAEWISSNETLNQFRIRKGMSAEWFYKVVRKQKWVEEKNKIKYKAIENYQEKAVQDQVDKWEKYRGIQSKLLKCVESVLDSVMDENGEVKGDLPPEEIRRLSAAFKELTQNQSFMDGGPTERVESKNAHLILVQAIKEAEQG